MTNEFTNKRRDLLVDPSTGIITPAAGDVYKYAPFDHSDYFYANKVGSLISNKWQKILNLNPTELITPNPFEQSLHRNGLACWDAAIGIPACSIRSSKITSLKQLSSIRNTNTYWINEVVNALRNVGPLQPGKLLRPTASFMVDLVACPEGWTILEAAHVLAHVRGDFEKVKRVKPRKPISYYFRNALAEIIVAIIFNLPIGITNYRHRPYGTAMLPYGIFINVTDSFAAPYVRIACKNKNALMPDNVITVIQVALHIEPYPYGFTSGTLNYDIHDRWACLPTIINIVGFEIVDYLLHQSIIINNKQSEYVMHYLDLLPPNLISNYIELGKEAGTYKPDNIEWFMFDDWLDSESFRLLRLATPPLPCTDCLMHNYMSEGKPIKPKGWLPKKIKKNTAWDRYVKDNKSIFNLIRNATRIYEAQFLIGGLKSLKAEWRTRISNWKSRLKNLKRTELLESALIKTKEGKQLTKTEDKILTAYKKGA